MVSDDFYDDPDEQYRRLLRDLDIAIAVGLLGLACVIAWWLT